MIEAKGDDLFLSLRQRPVQLGRRSLGHTLRRRSRLQQATSTDRPDCQSRTTHRTDEIATRQVAAVRTAVCAIVCHRVIS